MRVTKGVIYLNGGADITAIQENVEVPSFGLQTITIKSCVKYRDLDRMSIKCVKTSTGADGALMVENDSQCEILEHSSRLRFVTRSSLYKTFSEETKELYGQMKAKLAELVSVQEEVNSIDEKGKILNNLLNNTVDPRVLSSSSSVTTLLGTSTSDTKYPVVDAIADLISYASKRGAADRVRKFELETAANEMTEELMAIRAQLANLCDPSICGGIDTLTTRPGLAVLEQCVREVERMPVDTVQDLILEIDAEKPCKVALQFEFTVNDVSWCPRYQCRFSQIDGDAHSCALTYSAEILQNSGLDWKDCLVYLSTGNPQRRRQPPLMPKLNVDIKPESNTCLADNVPRYGVARRCKAAMVNTEQYGAQSLFVAPAADVPEEDRSGYGDIKVKLGDSVTLKKTGDNKQIFKLAEFDVDASLYYHVMVDHKKVAYRAFCLKNTSEWTLYKSPSFRVYVDGSYIGSVASDQTHMPGAEFVVYAGVDEAVDVMPVDTSEYKSKSGNFIMGNLKKETQGIKLEITNRHWNSETKTGAIAVILSHRLPTSINQSIKVSVQEPSPKALQPCALVNDVIAVWNAPGTHLAPGGALTSILSGRTNSVVLGKSNEAKTALLIVHNTKTGNVVQKQSVEQKWSAAFSYTIECPSDQDVVVRDA